ncbi:MAG: hypothetical protein PHO15_05805 [Eubacteriales bacterium]|nr:hypothetical protein [Eubacteriales bacterium]
MKLLSLKGRHLRKISIQLKREICLFAAASMFISGACVMTAGMMGVINETTGNLITVGLIVVCAYAVYKSGKWKKRSR